MNATESRPPEPPDMLDDAIASVRQTDVADSLIERCRRNALALSEDEPDKRSRPKGSRSWPLAPIMAAAIVLLAINLLLAYIRLPSSGRRLAAVHTGADSRQVYVYSDLRSEVAPALDSGPQD